MQPLEWLYGLRSSSFLHHGSMVKSATNWALGPGVLHSWISPEEIRGTTPRFFYTSDVLVILPAYTYRTYRYRAWVTKSHEFVGKEDFSPKKRAAKEALCFISGYGVFHIGINPPCEQKLYVGNMVCFIWALKHIQMLDNQERPMVHRFPH